MKAATGFLKVVTIALALLVTVSTANAQEACLPRDLAVERLGKQFDEHVVGQGLVSGGRVMAEMFVSKTGSWTVLLTNTEGLSCVVASGESWSKTTVLAGDPA